MRYVIIGNSAAGIGGGEGIRQIDKDGDITVISSEGHHTYSRPLISYLLMGKATHEKMLYRNQDFYVKNNCKLLTNTLVTEIEQKKQEVVLSNGRRIIYDRLLVATGSSAFVPPFYGLETVTSKHTFMSLDDANNLAKAIDKKKKVLIIGAGLIGLKCAEGILDKVAEIKVIDMAPRILSSILNDEGAEIVQKHLEEKGIKFFLSNGVERFEKNKAVLKDGSTESFDILVLAVGVRPSTELLEGIVEIKKGIVVDEKSKTTSTNIYAAGDCTQTTDVVSAKEKIMALLPNAYMQGETAGINMAGGEKTFDKAIAMNAIGFFGLHVISAGNYVGEVYKKNEPESYKLLFYSNNHLNGYIMIGDVDKAGIYTSLIREHTPLDGLDFSLICDKPSLMAFSKEDRLLKLGGRIKNDNICNGF